MFAASTAMAMETMPAKDAAMKKVSYMIKGVQLEACACDLYCPCPLGKDATAADVCKGFMAWQISEGTYEGTSLKGLAFVVAVPDLGKNVGKSMGTWKGTVYLPKSGSSAQKKALEAIIRDQMGPAFTELVAKEAAIKTKITDKGFEFSAGSVASVKASVLLGANGKPTILENAPSPMALPKMTYCKADVDTYAEGAVKWNLAGRNATFGDFEMKSKD